jgi:hypothetical protein
MAVNLFTNGAGGNTWGTAGNWSLGTVPTATDGHDTTFDATSPNCTVNASNRVCNNIDFTGYTNTITMTFQITVSGNVTLDSTMGVSGSGNLQISQTSTITSNGKVWPNNVIFANSNTKTLIGDFEISGSLTCSTSTTTINRTTSEKIIVNGLVINGITVGTAEVLMKSGTWSGSSVTGIANNLTLDGNITISTNVYYRTGTLKYSSGTITVSGSTLHLTQSTTIDTDGMSWNDLSLANSGATQTLLSDLDILGTTTITAAQTINSSGPTLNTAGIAVNNITTGTAKVVLTGGTWSGTSVNGIANNVDINGNVTISGTVYYRTGTLTYVSGTVTTTGSTLQISLSCTLDTDGMIWNNVTTVNAAGNTYTLNSTLRSNVFTAGNISFALDGTHGFNVETFVNSTVTGITLTLKEGITYTITLALNCFLSRVGSTFLFTSSHASNKAILTLQNPAECNVLANFTRIDASNGRTIPTFNGTITDCLNIVEFHDLPTSSHAL